VLRKSPGGSQRGGEQKSSRMRWVGASGGRDVMCKGGGRLLADGSRSYPSGGTCESGSNKNHRRGSINLLIIPDESRIQEFPLQLVGGSEMENTALSQGAGSIGKSNYGKGSISFQDGRLQKVGDAQGGNSIGERHTYLFLRKKLGKQEMLKYERTQVGKKRLFKRWHREKQKQSPKYA